MVGISFSFLNVIWKILCLYCVWFSCITLFLRLCFGQQRVRKPVPVHARTHVECYRWYTAMAARAGDEPATFSAYKKKTRKSLHTRAPGPFHVRPPLAVAARPRCILRTSVHCSVTYRLGKSLLLHSVRLSSSLI